MSRGAAFYSTCKRILLKDECVVLWEYAKALQNEENEREWNTAEHKE